MSHKEAAAYTSAGEGYIHGIPAQPRPLLPGYDSGILTVFIIAVLLVSINGRNAGALLSRLGKNLWSIRRRANVFDDHTVGESWAVAALVFLTCVCEGTLVFSWLSQEPAVASAFVHPAVMMPVAVAGALAYYLFELVCYNIVGYTFTDKVGRVQWLRGFNASQALLGLCLLLPALVAIFYPALSYAACVFSLMLYLIARLTFIVKGLRIFYTGFSSILFFILYLCTLEIAPLALITRLCV